MSVIRQKNPEGTGDSLFRSRRGNRESQEASPVFGWRGFAGGLVTGAACLAGGGTEDLRGDFAVGFPGGLGAVFAGVFAAGLGAADFVAGFRRVG